MVNNLTDNKEKEVESMGKIILEKPIFHKWKCERCEHQWIPRTEEKPRCCPKCNSPYWDVPRKAAQIIAQ